MKIEISNGELVDKVSILSIKLNKIKDENKLKNIRKEFDLLNKYMTQIGIDEKNTEYKELVKINTELWEIEDNIRIKEKQEEFDEEFIKLARSVYFQNDRRFELKKKINRVTNSMLVEEKEYVKYR